MRQRGVCCLVMAGAIAVSLAGSAQAQSRYQVLDIGTSAVDMNNMGQVLGLSSLWDATNGTRSLTPVPGQETRAAEINDFGQVVGEYGDVLTPTGFIWDEVRGYRDLDTVTGLTSFIPEGITNSGEIYGYSTEYHELSGLTYRRAAVWSPSSGVRYSSLLPTGINCSSVVMAMNDVGQGVASYGRFPSDYRTTLWSPGSETQLEIPQAFWCYGLNNLGQAIWIDEDEMASGWLWTAEDGLREMAGEGKFLHPCGTDINDLGQIVGVALDIDEIETRFLWDEAHGYQDIADGVDPAMNLRFTPGAINNSGWIAGAGWMNGAWTGVLLVPVPEPGSLTLLAVGTVALLRRRRA